MSADREKKFGPGELWSLWELLAFGSSEFTSAVRAIALATQSLNQGRHDLAKRGEADVRYGGPLRFWKDEVFQAAKLISQLGTDFNCPGSAQAAKRLLDVLEQPIATAENDQIKLFGEVFLRALSNLSQINMGLKDELGSRVFLGLSEADRNLFEAKEPPFGQEVEQRFAIAIDDIYEASKCLALGRGTATVFHLMRVTEVGLKALAAELGIPYAPSWESYKRQLEKILDSGNYASLTPDQKAKRPFYLDVLGDVSAIKTAWRNPTMHIVKSYDVAQAAVIFSATNMFMRHLADNLNPQQVTTISTGQVGP
ncbi:MAG: hypothetical protein R3D35_08940 [Nitratireductor sp.]